MKFPWSMLISSAIVAAILRPIFPDNTDYALSAIPAGIILGIVYVAFKMRA